MNSRQVILITGVPGTGKTSVAETLATRLDAIHVNLSELAKSERLVSKVDEERDTAVVNLTRIRKRLEEMVKSKNEPLIVEGHFVTEIIPLGTATFIFVLRKAPWRLKKVLESRGYSKEKVKENLEAELLNVCLEEAKGKIIPERICEIDTTDRLPENVAEELFHILKGKIKCQHGYIDWLGCAESERVLKGE